ncbi:YheC/YheD family protein [Paenibacillus sp. M1]|uniref:YheC/YheD family protein n=1 Tax=Paenibacillus haidiansis TaxID=1574488 RepID=A0ABU7VVY8_9BACL
MGQDHVGILLNSSMYRGIPRSKTGQESLANYEEAARRYGLIPCFLRLGDIDLKQNKTIAYVFNGRDYVKTVIPIPPVIHNRALYSEPAARRKIQALQSQGTCIFNVSNRYGKDAIHGLLWNDPYLRGFLPETHAATPSSIKRMMVRHSDLILKPIRGSIGHGVMRLRKTKTQWELLLSPAKGQKKPDTIKLRGSQLPNWLYRLLKQVPYLVQERIPLAEYKGRPIDLRVTVQRGAGGIWGVTGMFTKAAPPGSFISNLAKGADAYPAPQLLVEALPPALVPAVISQVKGLALTIARRLSCHLPLLGDLGMDIGLTPNGHPYFIECNGRDQRYGFRKAGMEKTWKDTYQQPMAFARHLIDHPASAYLFTPKHLSL